MNKDRRSALADLVTSIESLAEQVQMLLDEETAAFENMPESLQKSERGQASDSAINELADAISSLEGARDTINGVIGA